MATKTVVCPDCGTPAEPGRYVCGDCGALLEGVAVGPRSSEISDSEPPAVDAERLDAVEDDDSAGRRLSQGLEPLEAREDAIEASEEAIPGAPPEPSWPPPGAREPLRAPEPRVPAGAYLPPSAVLPPIDAPSMHAGAAGAAGVAAVAASAPAASASAAGAWLRAIGSPRRRRAAGRRAIAIGAGIALVGFLLPWGTASFAGLAANWLVLWGLAGPGHWLVAAGLVAMAAITASSGRAEAWPVGLPAVILGALTLGLVWTQVFGPSRPFAVVIVLAGTALLIAGGTLEETGRHEAETQPV